MLAGPAPDRDGAARVPDGQPQFACPHDALIGCGFRRTDSRSAHHCPAATKTPSQPRASSRSPAQQASAREPAERDDDRGRDHVPDREEQRGIVGAVHGVERRREAGGGERRRRSGAAAVARRAMPERHEQAGQRRQRHGGIAIRQWTAL